MTPQLAFDDHHKDRCVSVKWCYDTDTADGQLTVRQNSWHHRPTATPSRVEVNSLELACLLSPGLETFHPAVCLLLRPEPAVFRSASEYCNIQPAAALTAEDSGILPASSTGPFSSVRHVKYASVSLSDGGATHPYFMGVNDRFAALSPLRGKIRDLCRGGSR